MNKKIKLLVVTSALIITSVSMSGVRYVSASENTNKYFTYSYNAEDSGLKFKLSWYSNTGLYNNCVDIAPGGWGFGLKIVDSNGEYCDLDKFNYRLTIDDIEYPGGVIHRPGSSTIEFISFYGDITGHAKIEASLKSDSNVKVTYEFDIYKDESVYPSNFYNGLYSFEDPAGILSDDMKVPNFVYDRVNAKYVVTLPLSPIKDSNTEKFMGWNIGSKVYSPGSVVIRNRDTTSFEVEPYVQALNGTWEFNRNAYKWSYKKSDGTYAKNEWIYSNGSWLYAKSDGYMAENELFDHSSFYAKSGGYIASDEWIYKNGHWYYAKNGGYIAKNEWIYNKGSWFYAESGRDIAENTWVTKNGLWYYAKSGGYMAENEWIRNNGSWFYAKTGGNIAENEWIYNKGSWFYAKSGGYIASNEWIHRNGHWYYAKNGGYIALNQTLNVNGIDYVFDSSGAWIK